MRLIWHWMCP